MSTDPHIPRAIRHKVDKFINNEGERDMTNFHERKSGGAGAETNTFTQRAGFDTSPAQVLGAVDVSAKE